MFAAFLLASQIPRIIASESDAIPQNVCTIHHVDWRSEIIYEVDGTCGGRADACDTAGCLWWDCHSTYCDCCVLTISQLKQLRSVGPTQASPQVLALQQQIEQIQQLKAANQIFDAQKSAIEKRLAQQKHEIKTLKLNNESAQVSEMRKLSKYKHELLAKKENKTLADQISKIENELAKRNHELLIDREQMEAENVTLSSRNSEIQKLVQRNHELLANERQLKNGSEIYSAQLSKLERELARKEQELSIDKQVLKSKHMGRPVSKSTCGQILAPEILSLERQIASLQKEKNIASARIVELEKQISISQNQIASSHVMLVSVIICCILLIGSVSMIVWRKLQNSHSWSNTLSEPLLPAVTSEVALDIEEEKEPAIPVIAESKEMDTSCTLLQAEPQPQEPKKRGNDQRALQMIIQRKDKELAHEIAEITAQKDREIEELRSKNWLLEEFGDMIKMQNGTLGKLGSDFDFVINENADDQDLRNEILTPRSYSDKKAFIRIIKVQCSGVLHKAISCDTIFNGCIVTIQREASLGVAATTWTQKFQFSPNDGLFEFQDDKMKLDHGYLTIVFRATQFVGRTVRFPEHHDMCEDDYERPWTFEDPIGSNTSTTPSPPRSPARASSNSPTRFAYVA